MNTIELAKQLISYDTTSPVIEEDVFDFLKGVLEVHGVDVEIHTNNEVKSLTATTGDTGTRVCFNGHVDVVPANNGWSVTDPFEPKVVDGKLYGRGAADMKGGLAAQIMAFLDLHDDPEFTDAVTLMVVGDEEIGGYDGTKVLLNDVPQFDYAIVGEPTDCNIQVGVRGIYWVDVFLHGDSVHASRPNLVDSVLEDLPHVLNALNNMELTYDEDDILPAPTAPVTVVETEGPQNSVPGQVRIGMDIRYLPGQTVEQVEDDIRNVLDPLEAEYELRITDHGAAFKLEDDRFLDIATDAVESVTDRTPRHVTDGGSSDGRFFAEQGTPFIELGPNREPGHQADEWCRVDHLKQLREMYCMIAKRLAAEQEQTPARTANDSVYRSD